MNALISSFLFVAKTSLTACIIVAIVLAVRLLAGKKLPRRFSYAMWGLVLLRLILPVSLPSPVSIFTPTDYTPQYTIYEDLAEAVPPTPSFPSIELVPETPAASDEEAAASIPKESSETSPTESVPAETEPDSDVVASLPVSDNPQNGLDEQLLPVAGSCIWICGVLLLLMGGAGTYLVLLQKYKTACLYHDQQLFDRCNRLLRHPLRRRVALYTSACAESPMVIGYLRPRIILPDGVFPEEQLECMVVHELIHIRRGDHLIRLVSLAVTCVHWFNPLIWLALKYSAKDMELSCDEAALSRLGSNAAATYAGALLDLSVRQHRLVSPLLMFGESNLKTRIKNALSYKKPALWVSIAAVLLLTAGAVVLLTDPIREPAIIQSGDTIQANLAGIPLTVTADEQTVALLNPEDWQQTDSVPVPEQLAALDIETKDCEIVLSQTDPVAILRRDGTETSYTVPLGTEETLRARLLEASDEYAMLPDDQQQILSAVVNAETMWGLRDYGDYFAVGADFVTQFAQAILSNPGQPVSGQQPGYSEGMEEISLQLVNPRGTTAVYFWSENGSAVLSMGETQVSVNPDAFQPLAEAFQSIPYTGWSTNIVQTDLPGYTELAELTDNWQIYPAGDWLVGWGWESEGSCALRVYHIPDGELVYSEETERLNIQNVRVSETSLYDLEITGISTPVNASGGQTNFVWGIRLNGEIRSDYDTIDGQDGHLTDDGLLTASFPGENLMVTIQDTNGSEQVENVLILNEIRDAIAGEGMFSGDVDGLDNIRFSNEGRTITADLSMTGYPFVNGMVAAVQQEDGWKTRILAGSPLYTQGGLLNSFHKILDDGTILYAYLDDNGWNAELIDQNSLETIRTLDFGSYSFDYLSLEGVFPLSISGDSFYSPRVILRMIDRERMVVIDRSYKLNGQRAYLFNFAEGTLSEPMLLNGVLNSCNDSWLLTVLSTSAQDGTPQPLTVFSRPLSELADSLQPRELRPVLDGEETQVAEMDPVLVRLFDAPIYLTLRESGATAYSDTLSSAAFHPLRWTKCSELPDLPAQPAVTAIDIADTDTGYASANFYETDEQMILELLPAEPSEPARYYTAPLNQAPDYLTPISEQFSTDDNPYTPVYNKSDAEQRQFASERQLELLDAAAVLQTGNRQRYDNWTVHVLTLEGNTAVCLAMQNPEGSYSYRQAAPGLVPDGATQVQVGGITFWQTDDSLLFVYTAGENPTAVSLSDGLAAGLIDNDTLAMARDAAAEEMPRLYREETTFRIEQLLNCMRWQNQQTGNPAAMMYNQFYYVFAERMAKFRASDEWDAWTQRLAAFLEGMEGYPDWSENLSLAVEYFFPGEIYREVIADAWGADAQIDWDYPGNLIGYYPEEDIVESAYGVGFETSSHLYPVAMTQSDGRLTVSYVTLIWYPDTEGAHIGSGDQVLDSSWSYYPTLAELTARADELPLQTAEFVWEDGRWIFAG